MDFSEIIKSYENYFEDRIKVHGDNVKSLWNGSLGQFERFKILSEIADLNNSALLDVGCGFGDMLIFLSERGIKISSYIGIDISNSAINICKNKYPNQQFYLTDIFSFNPESIDYLVASGIFFLPSSDWDNYTISVIERMFTIAKKGVAVNFLSSYSLNKDTVSYYANPSHVLELIQKRISVNTILRHDYRQNDFTIYIYKK